MPARSHLTQKHFHLNGELTLSPLSRSSGGIGEGQSEREHAWSTHRCEKARVATDPQRGLHHPPLVTDPGLCLTLVGPQIPHYQDLGWRGAYRLPSALEVHRPRRSHNNGLKRVHGQSSSRDLGLAGSNAMIML